MNREQLDFHRQCLQSSNKRKRRMIPNRSSLLGVTIALLFTFHFILHSVSFHGIASVNFDLAYGVTSGTFEFDDTKGEKSSETTLKDGSFHTGTAILKNMVISNSSKESLEHSSVPSTLLDDSSPAMETSAAGNREDNKHISVAMCHKTLFGDIDLRWVAVWAAYHRMLGFDHLYIWYLKSMEKLQGFDTLKALPFVTLVENTKAKVKYGTFVVQLDPGIPGNQLDTEKECLQVVAKDYDWVMNADAE